MFILGQRGDQKWWDREGVKIQIQNAAAPVIQLYQVWNVRDKSLATELRIFRSRLQNIRLQRESQGSCRHV